MSMIGIFGFDFDTKENHMRCKACGSDDVTQTHGRCNECKWIYEQEKKTQVKAVTNDKMSNIFDFVDEERDKLIEFTRYWVKNHQLDPKNFPLAVKMENSGTWLDKYISWRENK